LAKNAFLPPFMEKNGKFWKDLPPFKNRFANFPTLRHKPIKPNTMGKVYDSLLSGTSGRTGRIVA